MNPLFQNIYETIWKEVFPNFPIMEVEKFKTLIAKDVPIPVSHKCSVDQTTDIYSNPENDYKRFISDKEIEKRREENNWMENETLLKSLEDVLKIISPIAMFKGSRKVNSETVEQSDDIYASSHIYGSTHVYRCQKMIFCFNLVDSEYLMASNGVGNCSFGIRLVDSVNVSNSYEIHTCTNIANSYFCHNCFDLRECMFCFHLTSKQYCIANRQFTKSEYELLKEKLLRDYFKQIEEQGAFRSLVDL